jgi:hypothetical protein
MPSKWFAWEPTRGTERGDTRKPTKPTKPCSVGSEGSHPTAFSVVRSDSPLMPPGVRLVAWSLKEPPVLIETSAVVVNPELFARSTLMQLEKALANPTRWVGWRVEQLMDRLGQVGVVVNLESGQ